MTPPETVLALYHDLHKLHTEMAASAVGQRFTELPQQQEQVNAVVTRLQSTSLSRLSAEQRAMISSAIGDILAKQQVIKSEIADWQSDILPLLASFDAHPPGK